MIIEGIKNIFRRRSTQNKPSVSPIFRGKQVYYPEKCKGHGLCIRYCPTNAIKFRSDRKIQIDLNRCVFCGQCEDVCPEGAIKMTNFYKMLTSDKAVIYGEEK